MIPPLQNLPRGRDASQSKAVLRPAACCWPQDYFPIRTDRLDWAWLARWRLTEKQGPAISKSPTLNQMAVGKLPLYHGLHGVSAKGFFVMSSGVETSLTARERKRGSGSKQLGIRLALSRDARPFQHSSQVVSPTRSPSGGGPARRILHSGRNDRKSPSGRHVHQPCG